MGATQQAAELGVLLGLVLAWPLMAWPPLGRPLYGGLLLGAGA